MDRLQNPIVKYPFGAASIVEMPAQSGNCEIEVINSLTIVDGATVAATGDRTLDIDPEETLTAGARVVVKTKSTATEKLIPGANMKGETLTGVAGKTQVVEYIWDGENFIQTGKSIQID